MNSRGTSHRPRAALANTSAPSLKAKTSTHFTGSPRSKLPNVPNKHDDSLTTPSVSAQAMSIREAIALKRAEARKAMENRSRSVGSVNFAARSLPCIPSGLFEIHLGVTPERLASVTEEPALPPPDDKATSRRRGDVTSLLDLHVLKAGNNDIIEIQPEISMFGSLKNIDVDVASPKRLRPTRAGDSQHFSQRIRFVAVQFALRQYRFALAAESRLWKLLHADHHSLHHSSPRLTVLDASHNQIVGDAIDIDFPSSIVKLDLSSNPLSSVKPELLDALAALQKLRELRLEKAEVTNSVFHAVPFSAPNFPALPSSMLGKPKSLWRLRRQPSVHWEGSFRLKHFVTNPRRRLQVLLENEVAGGMGNRD
ncbi:Iron-sulfur clusters transporter atm [Salix suchowensis]|nr:Iron-sulfur clusters transporter atm [Salix suchowensis]